MVEKKANPQRLLWRRVWAVLVDIAIVCVATLLVDTAFRAGDHIGEGNLLPIFLIITIIYHTYFEGPWGVTPGKLLLEIEVVREGTNDPPGMIRAFIRSALRLVDGLFGYLVGWAVATNSEKSQRLGDKAAGTVVIRTPEQAGSESWHTRSNRSLSETQQEQLQAREARFKAGEEGERRVREQLSELCLEGHYYLFNDLYEPAVGNIDHLVLGPCGMVLIETKANWGGLSLSDDTPVLINDAELARDPLEQVSDQMAALDQRFDYETRFHPGRTVNEFLGHEGHHWVLCFSRAWIEGPVGEHRARQVVTLKYLLPHIRSYETIFDDATIDYLARQVRDSYGQLPEPQPSSESNDKHNGNSDNNPSGRHGKKQRGKRHR